MIDSTKNDPNKIEMVTNDKKKNTIQSINTMDTLMIYPQRLVMIQMNNNCMFCEKPEGSAYTYFVCIPDKLGYICCEKCTDVAKKNVDIWNNTIAYGGRAYYLKEKIIKVKRSEKNGTREIEDGWIIDYPITMFSNETEMVHCYHSEKNIGRWCYIDEILELNPE
jgi:hypothetical protein